MLLTLKFEHNSGRSAVLFITVWGTVIDIHTVLLLKDWAIVPYPCLSKG